MSKMKLQCDLLDHLTSQDAAALPQLVHGGPGRAGGGEELGGIRAVFHFMQRTALQGSPDTLARISEPEKQGGDDD